jgi:hypothetical protein
MKSSLTKDHHDKQSDYFFGKDAEDLGVSAATN